VAVPNLGVTFASLGVLGPAGALRVAREAEALGYGSFWTAEANGTEAFSVLAAAGAAAPGLALGTGVIALQLRTPPLAAMAAATLQAFHPDRDILLGVGVSTPVVTSQWHGAPYGDRPLARVREYVALLRECLSGENVTFQGDFWSVKRFRLGVRLGDRKPKVVLAALGERMLRLAGEVADGVLLNYVPATHVPWSVEQVRQGGDARIYAYVHAGVADRETSLEPARRDLFSYAVADAYARSFTSAGFGDEVAEVRARHRAGDREGAVGAISQAMVDAIDFTGTPDEVGAFVRSYAAAGVDEPVLMPLPWGKDRMGITLETMRAAAG
jgi:probable F420-dependent oxidoreductase